MGVRISVRTEITLIENPRDDGITAHKPVVNAGTEKDQTTPASLQFVSEYKCVFNPRQGASRSTQTDTQSRLVFVSPGRKPRVRHQNDHILQGREGTLSSKSDDVEEAG